jgi:hypothetical protein
MSQAVIRVDTNRGNRAFFDLHLVIPAEIILLLCVIKERQYVLRIVV